MSLMGERIRGNAWKIKWNEWNKEAFERAKKENKLVLLSLAGVWCHWCHVMDETTYSDEEVINLINENFIPIRVDVDERPDISERYNFGGYPTFAFLTDEGEIITGGTYVPPEQFKEILKEMIEIAKKGNIKELLASSTPRKKELKKANANEKIIWDVVDVLITYFDESYGGFGIEPKFPLSDAIIFLLDMYNLTKKEGFKIMVKRTLDGIANGLFDNVEGGFYRYSVTRDWLNPHFEKMLETNSGLIKCFAYFYYLTKEEKYKEIAEKTANYLLSKLKDPNGLFYSSQDADEVYYSLPLESRISRNPPYIDKNIYSCKNASCAEAFLKVGIALDNKDYINIAINIAEKIIKDYFTNEGIVHSLKNKESYLDDNVATMNLLLNVYYVTFDENYLKLAENIGNILINEFLDSNKLFKDRKIKEDSFGLLKEPYHPIAENSLAMKVLRAIGEILNNEQFKKVSEEISSILAANYLNYSIFASSYADSLLFCLEPIEIRIVGKEKALEYSISKKLALHPSIYLKNIEKGVSEIKEGIYVCKANVCYPPIKEDKDLSDLIEKLTRSTLKI